MWTKNISSTYLSLFFSWEGVDWTDEFRFSFPLVFWIDQKQQRIEAAVWKSPIFKQWFKMDFSKGFPKGCTDQGTVSSFEDDCWLTWWFWIWSCSSIFILAILLQSSQILVKSARWALAASLLFSIQDSLVLLCHNLYFLAKLLSNGNNFDTLYMVTLQNKIKRLLVWRHEKKFFFFGVSSCGELWLSF